MYFIINIISMLIGNDFTSSMFTELGEINFNKIKNLDNNNFYFIEDCYTNDLDLFFNQYDNLVQTKKSSFFYKSNLVNISILLKCFNEGCIQKISKSFGFYKDLKDQLTDNFDTIFSNFQHNKKIFIKFLLEAYIDYDYEKIKQFYILYLRFYYDNFQMLKLQFSNIDTFELIYNKLNKIIEESGPRYFVYLSCNLPSVLKFFKFEMTRMLISYLGFRDNSDHIYNSIDAIEHDFGDQNHVQYSRKLSYSDLELNNLREMIKKIFQYFSTDSGLLEKIINFMHDKYYEKSSNQITIQNIIDQIRIPFSITNIDITNYIISPNIEIYNECYPDDKKFNIIYKDKRKILQKLNQQCDEAQFANTKTILFNELKKVIPVNIFNFVELYNHDPNHYINVINKLELNELLLIKYIISNKKIDIILFYNLIKFFNLNYYSEITNNIFINIKQILDLIRCNY